MGEEKSDFLAKVRAAVRDYGMLGRGDSVLVAVSGGPDSVALLHAMIAIRSDWHLHVAAAHLNHQLRGEVAAQEAAFVQRLASALEIPCEVGSADVRALAKRRRLSIQEAAREARYAFLEDVADRSRAHKIALGHQADDNAESMLIHLLRGTGPKGLAGIPPVRGGRVIRPLIDIPRAQILGFLEQQGIAYQVDRSNFDPKYLRSRIRHEVIPCLEKNFHAEVVSPLTRLASILREEEQFWEKHVENTFTMVAVDTGQDGIVLSAKKLATLHPALLRRLVRHVVSLSAGSLRRFEKHHVEAVLHLAGGDRSAGILDLPHGLKVVRDRDEISFQLHGQKKPSSFEYCVTGLGTTVIPEIGRSLRLSVCEADEVRGRLRDNPASTALFDLDTVSFPLVVRSFREGDRFVPLGMSGSQKVKDFFINRKVPRFRRVACPLVVSQGRIIWVGEHRIAEPVKVSAKTKKVLQAEILPL